MELLSSKKNNILIKLILIVFDKKVLKFQPCCSLPQKGLSEGNCCATPEGHPGVRFFHFLRMQVPLWLFEIVPKKYLHLKSGRPNLHQVEHFTRKIQLPLSNLIHSLIMLIEQLMHNYLR